VSIVVAIDADTAALAALLGGNFTVFHYDRHGRGDGADTARSAVEREIDDLEALIIEAGGSAAVFGMSSGVALALEAANRGLPITKLALYEPPFIVDDDRPAQWAAVTVPTLVMDRGASPAWIRNAVRKLAGSLPNAQRLTLDDQTHVVASDVLAPALKAFFADWDEVLPRKEIAYDARV